MIKYRKNKKEGRETMNQKTQKIGLFEKLVYGSGQDILCPAHFRVNDMQTGKNHKIFTDSGCSLL